MGIGSILIRSGVIIGAVYYTNKVGIWSDTKKTQEIYDNIVNELRPHVDRAKKQLPFEVPSLPRTGEVRFLAKHYYNNGVKETFHFVQMIPCYTGQMFKKAKDTISEYVETPTLQTIQQQQPVEVDNKSTIAAAQTKANKH